jgi:hypothetical protein
MAASAVNKITFSVLRSVNTPDFPEVDWVINSANLDGLVGFGTDDNPDVPKRYWIVDPLSSQNLREMNQTEKDAVDVSAGPLLAAQEARKAFLQVETDAFVESRYSLSEQQNLANLQASVSGEQAEFLDSYFDWYQSVYNALSAALVSVDAATTIPTVEAVVIDYSPYIASDPEVTVEGVLALAPGSVIGEGFSVYSGAVSTTTSTSFQTKVELQNTVLTAGKYRIIFSYGWNVDSTASDIEVKLQEKVGAGSYADVGEIHKQEISESGGTFGFTGTDQRFYTTRVLERTLTADTYSWRIQFRSETTVAASIWETLLRIEGTV